MLGWWRVAAAVRRGLATLTGFEPVFFKSGITAKNGGDASLMRMLVQKYRHIALISFAVIQVVIDQGPLPEDSFAYVGRNAAFDSPLVLRRTDTEHEFRVFRT
jgi:hypothetical protein